MAVYAGEFGHGIDVLETHVSNISTDCCNSANDPDWVSKSVDIRGTNNVYAFKKEK